MRSILALESYTCQDLPTLLSNGNAQQYIANTRANTQQAGACLTGGRGKDWEGLTGMNHALG